MYKRLLYTDWKKRWRRVDWEKKQRVVAEARRRSWKHDEIGRKSGPRVECMGSGYNWRGSKERIVEKRTVEKRGTPVYEVQLRLLECVQMKLPIVNSTRIGITENTIHNHYVNNISNGATKVLLVLILFHFKCWILIYAHVCTKRVNLHYYRQISRNITLLVPYIFLIIQILFRQMYTDTGMYDQQPFYRTEF
jgi:hypothetical protein